VKGTQSAPTDRVDAAHANVFRTLSKALRRKHIAVSQQKATSFDFQRRSGLAAITSAPILPSFASARRGFCFAKKTKKKRSKRPASENRGVKTQPRARPQSCHRLFAAAGLRRFSKKNYKFHLVRLRCTNLVSATSGPASDAMAPPLRTISSSRCRAQRQSQFEGVSSRWSAQVFRVARPLVCSRGGGRRVSRISSRDLISPPKRWHAHHTFFFFREHPFSLATFGPRRKKSTRRLRCRCFHPRCTEAVTSEVMKANPATVWKGLQVPPSDLLPVGSKSTYINVRPPFDNMPKVPPPLADIHRGASCDAGDSVYTTDIFLPAGSIPWSAAGKY